MAWNGFRTIEITRLRIEDVYLKQNKIAVWSKGKSARAKDLIKLFAVPKAEVSKYLKFINRRIGRLFERITKHDVDRIIASYFQIMRLPKGNLKYSPHSLRHTAGQLMYDKGIRLEFIQKTLRHSVLETTLVYAQRAIDRNYFKKMPSKY